MHCISLLFFLRNHFKTRFKISSNKLLASKLLFLESKTKFKTTNTSQSQNTCMYMLQEGSYKIHFILTWNIQCMVWYIYHIMFPFCLTSILWWNFHLPPRRIVIFYLHQILKLTSLLNLISKFHILYIGLSTVTTNALLTFSYDSRLKYIITIRTLDHSN